VSRYTVYVIPRAWDEIKSLPGHMRQRVRRAIDGLADNPHPPQSSQLKTERIASELYRLRLDRWRIVYAVTEEYSVVDVLAVRKRPPYDYGDLEELIAELTG
jgi:mRNA interferase RelE/StbE